MNKKYRKKNTKRNISIGEMLSSAFGKGNARKSKYSKFYQIAKLRMGVQSKCRTIFTLWLNTEVKSSLCESNTCFIVLLDFDEVFSATKGRLVKDHEEEGPICEDYYKE